MARLARIQIADKNSSFDCGAAFLITQKCKVNNILQIDTDWELETGINNPYVVVRGKGISEPSKVFELAHEKTQQGLDLLSITNIAHLSIRNASDEYLIWWRENNIQVLRTVFTVDLKFEVPPVNLIITDSTGNIVPNNPSPPTIYHDSLRYFRLAQITEDLFDAYRNMWLAFELLLSFKYPKTRKEGERAWLDRVLRLTDNNLHLPNVFGSNSSDIVSEIIDRLYEGTRLKLFHAKQSYSKPHSLDDRKRISEALKQLTQIVIFLCDKWLNAKYLRGGITNSFFKRQAVAMLTTSEILISDVDISTYFDNDMPTLENMLSLSTKYAPEQARPDTEYMIGSINLGNIDSLTNNIHFVVKQGKELILGGNLETKLGYDSIDRLECMMGLRLQNVREPKKKYDT